MFRPSWDDYFMEIAYVVAKRATCDRKLVGAVIVDDRHRIVSTGYNGSPAGMPHCSDYGVGHELKMIDGRMSCVRTLHAESNALDDAGRRARDCTIYVTVVCCYPCMQRLVNAGIRRIVYDEWYESQNTQLVTAFARDAGVELVRLKETMRQKFPGDPVYTKMGRWYWYDETGALGGGPFYTEEACDRDLKEHVPG